MAPEATWENVYERNSVERIKRDKVKLPKRSLERRYEDDLDLTKVKLAPEKY